MTTRQQLTKVKQRMFTDAEVQAVQPNVSLRVLRLRLQQLGYDLDGLRQQVADATYWIDWPKPGVRAIRWPGCKQLHYWSAP